MKTTTINLINELKEQVQDHINYVLILKRQELYFLQHRNSKTSWNILECLEHLNLYEDYYLPEIERIISKSTSKPKINYTSGWLGNYFANSMLVAKGISKIKTFKDKNPLGISLDISTIDRFLEHQNQLLHLLERAKEVNLERERIKISIVPWLTIQLGDIFRFIVNHDERHIAQAQKINP
ncbi:DinB family protein [Flavobacterium oreochromis]|uniref:DinB family protein n=1 Tax=Flavobacterium oreochromis TaxID=2906078 RepID=A0ABW8P8D3_9FLAO|nr:DinB family protein [Flavobacterium oreochromis]OWP78489.1 hypothetical protein BWG23_01600 [Flavobacterium oreochromis]QYS86981.1 DinB family protein [Flavobacterium oreochromis]